MRAISQLFFVLSVVGSGLVLTACAPTNSAPENQQPLGNKMDLTGCGRLQGAACEVLKGINFQRHKNELSILRISPRCQAMAEEQARDMAKNQYLDHVSPTRGDFLERLELSGLEGFAGENIAFNYTPTTVVNAWMNSTPHRANILDRRFRSTGLAVSYDSRRAPYYVQCFSTEPGVTF